MTKAQRDELVSELTSFYEFLVGLHLPADVLKRPPPGGWPGITQERLGFLNKDDDVIDVLRHIPYITRDDHLERIEIHRELVCNDYTGAYFETSGIKYRNATISEPLSDDSVDSSIATLARPPESDGYFLTYNTAEHTVDMFDEVVGKSEYFGGVKEFFEMLKNEYRELSAVPVKLDRVILASDNKHRDFAQLQALYRRYGWPMEPLREESAKKDCLREADDLAEKLDLI